MSEALTKYDAMCTAIMVCHEIDEVAEIRNKARAMEVYAQQAMNLDAERQAVEIRIRAERKAGQMLKEMERGKTGPITMHREYKSSEFAQAKEDANISTGQAQRWQKLAEIPDKEFEETVKGREMPTTNGILRQHVEIPMSDKPMDKKAIAFWGEMQNFNRIIKEGDIKRLLNEMTDSMKASVFLEAELIMQTCEAILNERL